ncbi:hypothetical protein GCM10023187_27970 [Nibrella viscosa]|uniref:Uncharacterized protein n=1 Tax=Nibrella viscosa TaxID=1084524 RepID=A0ABP8KJG4_9BACT
MQKHPIDELFGRKLEEASLKPNADAWARLQARQGTQMRPVAVWWYASAAACLLLIGLAGYWVWQTNVDTAQKPAIANREAKPQLRTEQSLPKEKPQKSESRDTGETAIASVESKVDKKAANIAHASPNLPKAPVEIGKQEVTQPDNTSGTTESEPVVIAKVTPVPSQEVSPAPPTAEEKTLVVQLVPPQKMLSPAAKEPEPQISLAEQTGKKKRTKVSRILHQLNNLREGEPIDWQEVGVQPGALLAKATKTVDESREKIADSYENIRSNTFKKNAEK